MYIVFSHVEQSGMSSRLTTQCISPSASRYALRYTGIHGIDRQFCGVVACFHALIIPSNIPFNAALFSSLAAVAIIPAIERTRQIRHVYLELHVFLGLVYQRLTAAAILPLYWLIFITTGAASQTRGGGAKIDQAHAEAIMFSLAVGYVLP
jgi:hypothetical protein